MRKFFYVLVLVLFSARILFGGEFDKEFNNFDKNFANANYENKLKLHHGLKNIYIKTIINNDENTKIKVLQRLVKSANGLKLDSNIYNNELKELYKKYPNMRPKTAKNMPKINQNQQKNIENKINKNTIKASEKKENSKKDLHKKQNQIYILNASANKNEMKLFFNQEPINIPNPQTFKNNGFQSYIFNFENVIADKPRQFDFGNINASLVRYSPRIARFVIRSKNDIKIDVKIKQKSMIFTLEQQKIQTSKNTQNATKNNQEKQLKFTQKSETKPKITPQNNKKTFIKNHKIKNNSLIIELDNNPNIKEIKFSKNNVFYEIFELQSSIASKQNSFKFSDFNIKIAQYDTNTARIVFSGEKKPNINFKREENSLIFTLNQNKDIIKNTEEIQQKNTLNTSKNTQNTPKITAQNKISKNTPSISPKIRKNKLITIDAGHGGKDSGAVLGKRYEKNITLQIALKLKTELIKRGYRVHLTRSNDVFIGLRNRTKIANDKNADLFISIHANSVPKNKHDSAYGIETYFLSPARSQRSKNAAAQENKSDIEEMDFFSKQTFLNFLNREKIIASNKLAIDIQLGILQNLRKHYKKHIKDGGVREAPFWVLVGALMPAILVEVGYITHPIEGANIANTTYQSHLAKGIADGIDAYFAKNH